MLKEAILNISFYKKFKKIVMKPSYLHVWDLIFQTMDAIRKFYQT